MDRLDELARSRAGLVDEQEAVYRELRRLDRCIAEVDAQIAAQLGRGHVGGA